MLLNKELGGKMGAGKELFMKDPIFTVFYILGYVYIFGALLAGLYITYDWWKEKKKKEEGNNGSNDR
jgi:4-hydroxybenzoate polyprenyltransferase